MDYYIFKDRLNEAMKYRELTASELARKSGLDKGSISRYLKGENLPRTNAIEKIAKALNVNPAWLIGYDVPMIEAVDYIAEVEEKKILIEKLTPENREKLADYIKYLLSTQKEDDDDNS